MVNLKLQFSDSCLCLSEQLPNRASMVMSFRRKCNEILQSVIIPNSIDVVNLPTFRSWPMSIFPNNNMFKNLMSSICSWVVSNRKKNITITVFNSSTFPIRVFLTLSIFVMALTTLLRVPIHPATATWANLSVSLGILIGIATPLSSLFFTCHDYIIADEIQLGNYFMRQKPHGRMGRGST